MKVFVAEPFAHARARLTEMLASLSGAQVVGEADSVQGAVAAILAQKPDVALLSLKLSDGSAFDVIHEIHPREPGVACYVLSNFDSVPYRRYAERLGAAAFIDKSGGLDALREMLAAALPT